MADLRSNFENTLVTLRNQPFELRWARYWSMVLEALEYAPESLEFLNRLIVDQEEQLAARDKRQTIAKILGPEREQLRREADDAVMDLLAPFFKSEGSPAERAALASERRRIRSEIHPHAQRADGADAYETYVLVLDYATAFAAASASAFRTSAATDSQARTVQPAPPAGTLKHPEPQPAVVPHQPPPQQQPSAPPPTPRPEQRAPDPRYRSEPPIPARAPQPQPARGDHERLPRDPAAAPRPDANRQPAPGQRPPAPREAPPHHSQGNLQPLEQREARPIPLAMHGEEKSSRGKVLGWAIGGVLVIALVAGGGAAYTLKPEWFDLSSSTSTTNDDAPTETAEDTTTTPADEPEADTPPAPAEPEVEIPSTALDRFYNAIIDTKADTCTPPAEIAKSNWKEIAAFADCGKTQGVELMSTFRFMLSQAGGKWSENGNWAAPAGDMRVQLESAWIHITQTRSRWEAQANAAIKEYAASYFGFQSHGTTGWRFAAWRCRCNLKGEFIAGDTTNVKPRLFITPPALIDTEEEARQAYTQVRNFFLGATAPGKPPAVEQGANAAALPYDLPGGLGMSRPFQSKEEAQAAWQEVSTLHIGIGFDVSELNWGGN